MKFNGREISIYSAPIYYGVAHFYNNDDPYTDDSGKDHGYPGHKVLCEICKGEYLSPTYVYIISILREANLLPDDYKMLCCQCYNEKYPDLAKKENERFNFKY